MRSGKSRRVMGLEGYGLEIGKLADMVVPQAADPIAAVRLRAMRLAVISRGRVAARTPPRVTGLMIPERPDPIDPASYAPRA
jgi:cytosine deaminase